MIETVASILALEHREIPAAARALSTGVLHDYGKAPRPGRKLGHVTVTAETATERDGLVDIIRESVTWSAMPPETTA